MTHSFRHLHTQLSCWSMHKSDVQRQMPSYNSDDDSAIRTDIAGARASSTQSVGRPSHAACLVESVVGTTAAAEAASAAAAAASAANNDVASGHVVYEAGTTTAAASIASGLNTMTVSHALRPDVEVPVERLYLEHNTDIFSSNAL